MVLISITYSFDLNVDIKLFIPDNVLLNETPMSDMDPTNNLARDCWDESSFETSYGRQRCGTKIVLNFV